jgi:hypothetical protein
MDFDNLTPDQVDKVFKFCDIMKIEDIFLATTYL